MPSSLADVFGKPGEGPHRFRIGGAYPRGVAVVDLLGTVLLSALAWWFLTSRSLLAFMVVFIIFMAVAFVSHLAFGVETAGVIKLKKMVL